MADQPDREKPRREIVDDDDFEATFEAHYAAVLAFARRRTDSADAANDIVAETFAVAWRRRHDIPGPARPWLFGVARKVLANQRRTARRQGSLVERLAPAHAGDAAEGGDPADLIGEREAACRAFKHLSERDREVLTLVAWEQLEAKDAARVLGCSTATFRVRLHRARRSFERHLAEADREPGDRCRRPDPPLNPLEAERGGAS